MFADLTFRRSSDTRHLHTLQEYDSFVPPQVTAGILQALWARAAFLSSDVQCAHHAIVLYAVAAHVCSGFPLPFIRKTLSKWRGSNGGICTYINRPVVLGCIKQAIEGTYRSPFRPCMDTYTLDQITQPIL